MCSMLSFRCNLIYRAFLVHIFTPNFQPAYTFGDTCCHVFIQRWLVISKARFYLGSCCMCLHILVMTLTNVIGHARTTPGKDTVDIINWMPNGDDLTVHCRSGNDDLGVHVVPHNVDYNWRFHSNFWEPPCSGARSLPRPPA